MKWRYYFFGIAGIILLIDQATKCLVGMGLPPYRSVPIIKGILHLTYIRNTGAAFGLFAGQRIPLIIIGIIVSAIVVYFHFRASPKNYFIQGPLALILGGSLGNLADRIFRSYVVDFIDFRFWPAFNIADVTVNLGIVLLIVRLVMRKEVL